MPVVNPNDLVPVPRATQNGVSYSNPYFAALERQIEAQNTIATNIGNLGVQTPAPPAQIDYGEKFDTLAGKMDDVVTTLRTFNRDDIDYVTALYAAAVDVSGIIVSNTNVGKWLIEGWNSTQTAKSPRSDKQPLGICDIAKLTAGRRTAYYHWLLRNDTRPPGLARMLTEDDIRRFLALAEGVCAAIGGEQSDEVNAGGATTA